MSPIRVFFILPIVAIATIAFLQLFIGTFLSFSLWSFATLVTFLVCWPIISKMTMKYVPIYQIFSLTIGFLILMIIFSFFDISRYTSFTKDKVLILSIFSGFIITIIALFIHGQKGNG